MAFPTVLDSLTTYLTQGGPTLWVLIACSILLIALIYERWSKLRVLDIDHEWLLAQMSASLQARDVAGATRTCQEAPGCLARVFEAGLYRSEHARDEIESAMCTRITQQSQLLEKNMATLGTMAVVAPFIGLFGTVLGIVRSFKDLGGSNPQAVNAGIAEALAATAAGLFVAILAVVCFNHFKNRIRQLTAQMNVSSAQLVEMIILSRTGRAFPQDLVRMGAPAPAPLTSHLGHQATHLSAASYAAPPHPDPRYAPSPDPRYGAPDARYATSHTAPPPAPYVPPLPWPQPPRDGAAA